MRAKAQTSVLFVCLGNICRSPLAEGVFRQALEACGIGDAFAVDSAGTGAWHVGSAPDPRSVAIAEQHWIDISRQKARKVATSDFERFDLILGMDMSNCEELLAIAPAGAEDRVHLFMDYAGVGKIEVPDPYYGGADGFLTVYRMIRDASEALAAKLDWRASAPASGHASSTM
jgi:protein-tyrosine phosphatase